MTCNVQIESEGTRICAVAYGGSRRQRGAAIVAAVRRYKHDTGVSLVPLGVTYSETYGFQHASYARYEICTQA